MTDGREATTLGRWLRTLRSKAGGSLDDMARETRIGERYLRALEADRFFELPAPVFVKGFIRAYCEYLGAAPDKPLALYARTLGVEAPDPRRAPVRARSRSSWISRPIAVSATMVLVFGGGLVGLTLAGKRDRHGLSAAATSADQASQRLVVKAVEPTWIQVQTDEGRAPEEFLQAGATREWTSGTRFVLSVGNAGAVEVELNGRPLAPLGARGAVIRQLSLPASPTGS